MSQSDVSKENFENVLEGMKEVFDALGKKKYSFIGHMNDFYLFMDGLKKDKKF